ncbi:MAG: MFS transporter, partial [Coxiellaceae bacterium]|nr:MFS transporter [Coxiellaceae bacterium]
MANAAVFESEENVGKLTKQSYQAWAVVLAASLFFFYEFIILNIFNSLNAAFVSEFHISEAELGNLSAFYFYANILFLFPAGMIIDRVSTRRLILTAMTVCVSSTFIFANAPNIWVAQLCRFAMGIGGAFCLLSCVRLASRWFEANKMALVVGVVVTIAFIGGMLAQYTRTPIEIYGWRFVMEMIALSGVFMIGAIYFFVKDYPDGYHALHE